MLQLGTQLETPVILTLYHFQGKEHVVVVLVMCSRDLLPDASRLETRAVRGRLVGILAMRKERSQLPSHPRPSLPCFLGFSSTSLDHAILA
jgi:hypothetical protein